MGLSVKRILNTLLVTKKKISFFIQVLYILTKKLTVTSCMLHVFKWNF